MMVLLLVFCIVILPKMLVFFMPFVIAGIIALIANPVVRFMEKKLRVNRKAGTAIIIIFVTAIVVLVLYLIINWLIAEFTGFMEIAPELWKTTNSALRSAIDQLQVYMSRLPGPARNWVDSFFDNFGTSVTNWLQGVSNVTIPTGQADSSSNMGLIFIGTVMGIIATYLFVAERDYISRTVRKITPDNIVKRSEIVFSTMRNAVGAYFGAQFKIMGVVYVILLIGLLILKARYAPLVGLLIALLDFLPFLGTGTVMLPWAIIKFIQQDYKMGAGILILWAVSQAVRQFIQPKFVGESMGIAPIPTIILLYVGFRVAGPIGLILAVPVAMIVINLYKAGVFSNFSYSIQLLFKDIDRFRRFNENELISEGIELIGGAGRDEIAALNDVETTAGSDETDVAENGSEDRSEK